MHREITTVSREGKQLLRRPMRGWMGGGLRAGKSCPAGGISRQSFRADSKRGKSFNSNGIKGLRSRKVPGGRPNGGSLPGERGKEGLELIDEFLPRPLQSLVK